MPLTATGDWAKVEYGRDDEEFFGWVQIRFGTLTGSLNDVPVEDGPALPDATNTPRPRPTETPTPTMTFTPSPTSDTTEAPLETEEADVTEEAMATEETD